MGKKFFRYKSAARLFAQGSANAQPPVQCEQLFGFRKRQLFAQRSANHLARVKSTGQKNVANIKSARPVDHGDGLVAGRGTKVRTAYSGSAPTNARTTASKVVPKKQPTLANATKVLFILKCFYKV